MGVIGQNLHRRSIGADRRPQTVTDCPGALPGHQPRRHTEPGMIINTGQRLRAAAVSQREPTDDIHLPQLHGHAAFPAFPLPGPPIPRRRVDHRRSHQRPIHRRLRRNRRHLAPGQLKHQPPRTPIRPRPPQLQHRRLATCRHLMRTTFRPTLPIREPLQAFGLIPGQPRMHRLPRHPDLADHLRNRPK